MNDVRLNKIVDAWVAAQEAESDSPEYRRRWWAISRVLNWSPPNGEPELLWRFILTAYRRELSEHVFGMLAASPLENLLSDYGAEYIERVEALVKEDAQFKRLLMGAWQCGMTDEVWERVQTARLDAPTGDS